MAIINNRSTLATDPIRNFRFLVTFYPHDLKNKELTTTGATFGFTSVSGMAVTTDSIPYREGGYNTTVHQIPGQTTFSPVTLQRGVMLGHTDIWKKMKQLFATVNQSGGTLNTGQNFRFDMDIQVLMHPIPSAGPDDNSTASGDKIALRFRVYNCWPTSVAYSDLNAGDNALLVEQMTLVHEGFDVAWGTQGTNGEWINPEMLDAPSSNQVSA